MSSAPNATLDEIEARLRAKPITNKPDTIEPTQQGRPPTERQRAIREILRRCTEAAGGSWDGPVPWRPIRRELLDEGFSNDTIRRAARDAGVKLEPPRGKTMAYPPPVYRPVLTVTPIDEEPARWSDEPGPAVTIETPKPPAWDCYMCADTGVIRDPETDRTEPCRRCAEERERRLKEEAARVVDAIFGEAQYVIDHHPNIDPLGACDPERLRHLIGLAPLRRSSLDTIAAAGARTVEDALRLDLDALVGADQADLMRSYARGE